MSTQQALTIVGGVIGAYFGEPELGAMLGSMAGAALTPAKHNPANPTNLKTPQMQYGAVIPRLYGCNRTSGSLAWYSKKRFYPGKAPGTGKGGPSAGTADNYEIDVLYILAADSDIVGISRVWINSKVVWTHRGDSPSDSVSASDASTTYWHAIRYLDGNPNQQPDVTIEAAMGVGRTPAYRYRQCVLIESLQLGPSGQLPLVEFECMTNAQLDPGGATRMLSYFDPLLPDSFFGTSAVDFNVALYLRDPFPTGSTIPGAQPGWTEIATSTASSAGSELILKYPGLAWSPNIDGDYDYLIAPDGASPITIEAYVRLVKFDDHSLHTDEVFPVFSYSPATSSAGGGSYNHTYFELYMSSGGALFFATNTDPSLIGVQLQPTPTLGRRTHVAIVIAASGLRFYVAGKKEWELSGDHTLPFVSGGDMDFKFGFGFLQSDFVPSVGNGPGPGDSVDIRVDEFAIRFREQYTGNSFNPPAHIEGPESTPLLTPEPVQLADVIRAEWERCGDPTLLDAGDVGGIPLWGFQSTGSVRGALEALAPIYHFGAVCRDKLYIVKQGGSIAMTVDYDDLGAGENQATADTFSPERASTDEIPQRVALTYINYSDDYANGTETGDRGSGDSSATTSVSTNLVMTPDQAKAAAEVLAAQTGVAATTATITVPDFYAALEPTDRISVPDEDGTSYEMRITRETYSPGIKQLELVRDGGAATVTTSGIGAGAGGSSVLTVAPLAVTSIVLMDMPILRDSDDNAGFYAVAKGSVSGSLLFTSPDEVTYTQDATFPTQGVFGACTSILNDWTGGRVFDEFSRLTVDVGVGVSLASTTRAAILNDQTVNAAAIGVDGRWELVQFRDAALQSPGVYILRGFLRGARGTEWASTGHTSGETFVLLTGDLVRVTVDAGDIGTSEFYKGVSAGRALSTASAVSFADQAIGKKSFAPVHLRVLGSTVSWQRRTRMSTRFASALGIYCPLGEASEAYDLELRDAGGALLATHAGLTTNSWSGDLTGVHSVTVYQRGLLGRGYPATLTI